MAPTFHYKSLLKYLLHPATLRKYSFLMEFQVTGSDASSCCCLHDTRTQCCLDALSAYLKIWLLFTHMNMSQLPDSGWITNQVSRTGSAEGSIPTSSLSWRPKMLASKTVYNPHGCSIACTFLSQNELEIVWLMSNLFMNMRLCKT